ncbi:hypothetical protein [Rhodopseudomonas palustris]|uniref:hypothetical protein n=1 Tax=Rhodopseudomonas palustris TaxID=1076 RepID=UPI000CEC6EBA|nr:hypothetical protein [Rhodopseudomonas palustris]PPQ42852.1 hypothetical protein CKO39_15025 [Rhodopseudomonas palustris]
MSPSLAAYRMRNEDAPLDLVKASPEWQPVIGLIDGWARQPLGPRSGFSSDELDAFARKHGLRFPPPLREWWRLAGRHPLVAADTRDYNSCFLGPENCVDFSRRDFLMIALDDFQNETGNGILTNFLSHPDPEIFGINTTIRPGDAPRLDWYQGKFIGTGLRVPTLALHSLMFYLFDRRPLLRDSVVCLELEDKRLGNVVPDARMIADLGLTLFANPTSIGDIYSDGADVIYHWMFGFACRNEDAADRIRRLVATRRRDW